MLGAGNFLENLPPPSPLQEGKSLITSLQVYLFYFLVKTKTISVDFVNDEETSYRLKVAREIEGNHSYFNKSMIVNNITFISYL